MYPPDSIRVAIEQDIPLLYAMDHIAAYDAGRREFIARAVSKGCCTVYQTEHGIAGYTVLEYTFFELGFVSLLYVQASHRRRGIGAALMRNLEARCTTCKLFTSTNLSNLPMQRLLSRLGYVLAGVVHHLDENDPEVFYVRYLSSDATTDTAP